MIDCVFRLHFCSQAKAHCLYFRRRCFSGRGSGISTRLRAYPWRCGCVIAGSGRCDVTSALLSSACRSYVHRHRSDSRARRIAGSTVLAPFTNNLIPFHTYAAQALILCGLITAENHRKSQIYRKDHEETVLVRNQNVNLSRPSASQLQPSADKNICRL